MKIQRTTKKFVTIPREEYARLKRKEAFADNALVQLELSLDDISHGRVVRVKH